MNEDSEQKKSIFYISLNELLHKRMPEIHKEIERYVSDKDYSDVIESVEFEFIYTPKHGSWLNMAEIELNVLMKQCLAGRIPDIDKVKTQAKAWQEARNNKNAKINWQFTADDARIKLKRLYPLCEDGHDTSAYLPNMVMILNNLANLHQIINDYPKAFEENEEILEIYRKLTEKNQNVYMQIRYLCARQDHKICP